MCCPPEEVILFPNEYDEFSSAVSNENTADDVFSSEDTEYYEYESQPQDDYIDNDYEECPFNQCVPPTFCNLTGAFFLTYRILKSVSLIQCINKKMC